MLAPSSTTPSRKPVWLPQTPGEGHDGPRLSLFSCGPLPMNPPFSYTNHSSYSLFFFPSCCHLSALKGQGCHLEFPCHNTFHQGKGNRAMSPDLSVTYWNGLGLPSSVIADAVHLSFKDTHTNISPLPPWPQTLHRPALLSCPQVPSAPFPTSPGIFL